MDAWHLIIPLNVRFDKLFFQVSSKTLLGVQIMAQLLHRGWKLEDDIQNRIADRTVFACAGWSCSRGFSTGYFCLGHGKAYKPMKETTRLYFLFEFRANTR